MTQEIENRIAELKKFLYHSPEEKEIDKIGLKKALFLLLRECLKERYYVIEIGSYKIDVTPKNLSVKYNSNQTVVEVSNIDVYYETIRDIETRFFCISQIKRDEFTMDTPVIRTTGIVTNIDGTCEEHFNFELYSPTEDNIKNYLSLPKNVELIEPLLPDDYQASVRKYIKITDPRTDVIDYLNKEKVVPVFLDTTVEKYKTQVDRREYTPNNYSLLLPRVEEIKSIISFIYSSMVDYYVEYMNENN
jgi:hypothetical protein